MCRCRISKGTKKYQRSSGLSPSPEIHCLFLFLVLFPASRKGCYLGSVERHKTILSIFPFSVVKPLKKYATGAKQSPSLFPTTFSSLRSMTSYFEFLQRLGQITNRKVILASGCLERARVLGVAVLVAGENGKFGGGIGHQVVFPLRQGDIIVMS